MKFLIYPLMRVKMTSQKMTLNMMRLNLLLKTRKEVRAIIPTILHRVVGLTLK